METLMKNGLIFNIAWESIIKNIYNCKIYYLKLIMDWFNMRWAEQKIVSVSLRTG